MTPSWSRQTVWAWPGTADLRRGYDGLFAMVRDGLGRDPASGEMFVFVNRSRRSSKTLWYDGSGWVLLCKRMNRGLRFPVLLADEEGNVSLTETEFRLFLDGSETVGWNRVSRRKIAA
jgi:transposase